MRGRISDRWLAVLLGAWAAFSIASIWLRPLWPVDETRYVSVAWEMWLRGDFLVPYVNGEPYSHKPPLLFWLIHLGWAVFGVNDWWPRLVGPLCAFASLPLLARLARLLWPEPREVPAYATWVLFGTLLFAAFVTLTMFDLLLMLCAMAGMVGVLRASLGERRAGFLWLGAGIGLGVLAKGPVILLHLLPVAVVAPWWAPAVRAASARWYLGLLGAVLLGAALALAWALPAGYFGGEAFRRAIFWGQTAGRVAESFAHRAPWWYYLPLLPAILFPWLIWPALWRGLRAAGFGPENTGARFLAAWLVLTVVGFSFVSGKQAKYLVPMLPAFALLAGYALAKLQPPARWWEMALPAFGFLALPATLAYARAKPAALELPEWASGLPVWPIVVSALAFPLLLAFARRDTLAQVRSEQRLAVHVGLDEGPGRHDLVQEPARGRDVHYSLDRIDRPLVARAPDRAHRAAQIALGGKVEEHAVGQLGHRKRCPIERRIDPGSVAIVGHARFLSPRPVSLGGRA